MTRWETSHCVCVSVYPIYIYIYMRIPNISSFVWKGKYGKVKADTYLSIVDKNNHNGISAHLLNGIQIPQRIHLVKPPIPAHTRTRPPRTNIAALLLQLQPALRSPPLHKPVIILARAAPALLILPRDDKLARALRLLAAKAAAASKSRLLKAARVGDHALHARGAAHIEFPRREVQHGAAAAGEDGGAHGLVDTALSIFCLFVNLFVAVVVRVVFSVAGVRSVCSVCLLGLGDDGVEFFLCCGLEGHGWQGSHEGLYEGCGVEWVLSSRGFSFRGEGWPLSKGGPARQRINLALGARGVGWSDAALQWRRGGRVGFKRRWVV